MGENVTENTAAEVNTGRPENGAAAPEAAKAAQGADTALLQKLQNIEQLLEKQNEYGKKTARRRGTMVVLLAALVLVFAWGLYSLNRTVSNAVLELPALITTTTQAVQQVATIDFEALNGTLGELETGLGQMDFEALNESIENLEKASKALSDMLSFFG